jgi:hypothetical protein
MAGYLDDDEQGSPSLFSDLSNAGTVVLVPHGLADTLSNPPTLAPPAVAVVAPQAAPQAKVPGYISSETGKFVPLLPGTSPGAFAAQQQGVWENLLSGYGAQTLNYGREAADLLKRGASAVEGAPGALLVPATEDPDKDIKSSLFKTSLAADAGRFGANIAYTWPVAEIAGAVAAPIAQSIQGETLLPSLSRAAIPGLTRGIAVGTAVPADDADGRLHNILRRGTVGAGQALLPYLKTLAGY